MHADRRSGALPAGGVSVVGSAAIVSGSANVGGGHHIDAVAMRALQQELADRNKELSDARHAHSKLKKMLAESNTELGHAGRRAEQYEAEVKRLRGRVEELKRELAGAEDELDATSSHVRRLQRNNEELLAQTAGNDCHRQQQQPLHGGSGGNNRYEIGLICYDINVRLHQLVIIPNGSNKPKICTLITNPKTLTRTLQ